MMLVALVGNQNSGKTSLFNVLTNSREHVGNFPGVTVDGHIGRYEKSGYSIDICDLPGIYSLSPYSNEEIVTRDFLIKQKPDVIINIVDATNIERNLYLTTQLCELNIPVVVAISMMDEMITSGNVVKSDKLSELLGVPCIPIIASKNEGIKELMDVTIKCAKNKIYPKVIDVCESDTPVHRAIHAVIHLIYDHAIDKDLPPRYVASHLIENDELVEKELDLSQNEKELIEHITKELENDSKYDKDIVLSMMRYNFIDKVCKETIYRKNPQTKEQIVTNKIDKILTNKFFAFPIFVLIMGAIFAITFLIVGTYLSDFLSGLFENFIDTIRTSLTNFGTNLVVISLFCDGFLTGLGSVLVFLPVIVCLFFFLSLLEDSGYMARIAFIMDKPLRKIGLSGRSFVPMLIGFGCSVPAVMSTRTLTSERDKKITLALIPFMPCSAKLPVITTLCFAFFKAPFWVILILYFITIFLGIFVVFIIHLITKNKAMPFIMELPTYRVPRIKNTIVLMWEKAKDFLKKAFSIILVASIIVWFLSSFDLRINYVSDSSNSLLAQLSIFLTKIFIPLGVDRWEVTASIIAGLSAKESVISTLAILLKTVDIKTIMTSLQAFSLLLFVILYMPCIATFTVMIKELKSFTKASLYMILQTAFAYLVSMIVYQIGSIWF